MRGFFQLLDSISNSVGVALGGTLDVPRGKKIILRCRMSEAIDISCVNLEGKIFTIPVVSPRYLLLGHRICCSDSGS